MSSTTGPAAVIKRLTAAIDRHDLDGIMECFAEDVRAESPPHPERDFRGAAQMRANWAISLESLVGLRAEIERSCADDDTVWVEWCWRARRPDGSTFDRAGVAIHGVKDDRIVWVRLYMELLPGASATDAASATAAEMARYRLH